MPTPKYYGRPTNDRQEPLWWPGTAEGLPVKGEFPGMTTDREFEAAEVAYDVGSKVLRLPDDLEEYRHILDMCANADWILHREDCDRDPANPGVRYVWITWLEPYGVKPPPNWRSPHGHYVPSDPRHR